MALSTNISLRQLVIYQVYTRNHTKEGTFRALINDLDRIKSLGTDVVYLLPIHPIGQKDKKGSLGCPYSIQDYRKVNPEYGTLEDFQFLIAETHKRGLKIMIDVVYNHTSRDSYLWNKHPDWFYRKPDGTCANRVGDWSDVTDLNYDVPQVWDELIDTLKYWVLLGIDGFRCDVASLVPLAFWMRAREEVAKVKKDVIWMAESVHESFVRYIRSLGYEAMSDSETFQAFDICYDYDIFERFQGYARGELPLTDYIDALRQQESTYPSNFVKMRCLENHDQQRAASLFPNNEVLCMWTTFCFMLNGCTMIYGGQEAQDANLPSLFDTDKVNWSKLNQQIGDSTLAALITKLATLKKDQIMLHSVYSISCGDIADTVVALRRIRETVGQSTAQVGVQPIDQVSVQSTRQITKARIAIFNFGLHSGKMEVIPQKLIHDGAAVTNGKSPVPDGIYTNLLDGTPVTVEDGKIELRQTAVIFDVL